jgi:hypothetical protein
MSKVLTVAALKNIGPQPVNVFSASLAIRYNIRADT